MLDFVVKPKRSFIVMLHSFGNDIVLGCHKVYQDALTQACVNYQSMPHSEWDYITCERPDGEVCSTSILTIDEFGHPESSTIIKTFDLKEIDSASKETPKRSIDW